MEIESSYRWIFSYSSGFSGRKKRTKELSSWAAAVKIKVHHGTGENEKKKPLGKIIKKKEQERNERQMEDKVEKEIVFAKQLI